MRAGISTACLYPMLLEESLDCLLSLDLKLFEVFFNTFREITPTYVKDLGRRVRECGAQVKSIHPFTSGYEGLLLFSDYTRRYEDTLEFYKQYFDAANQLGASVVVLHGQRDYQNSRLAEERYWERYQGLYSLGKAFGLTVAQENVSRFRSEDVGFIRRMRAALGAQCAFVLDIKQAVRAGRDPYEMCSAMGDRLVHVHLNDNTPQKDCLLPGNGVMQYDRLLSLMKSNGFDGDWIVEVYQGSFDKVNELSEAVQTAEIILRSFRQDFS